MTVVRCFEECPLVKKDAHKKWVGWLTFISIEKYRDKIFIIWVTKNEIWNY